MEKHANTLAARGAFIGSLARKRSLARSDSAIASLFHSVRVARSPADLYAAVASCECQCERGALDADKPYVPAFVKEDLRRSRAWTLASLSTRHGGTDISLCVVCTPAGARRGVHLSMARTLLYGADCVQIAAGAYKPPHRAGLPPSVRVTCILLPRLRAYPARGRPVAAHHINAGVTALPGAHVLVYRAQHADKVLLHELIHCGGLDAPLHDAQRGKRLERKIAARLNYDVQNLFEAYTETLACTWHMVYRCSDDAEAARSWSVEDVVYHAVCRQLLLRQTVATAGGPRDVHARVRSIALRERTNAFAYYFCKAALWGHLRDVPACIGTPADAERFWNRLERCVLDAGFWQRLFTHSEKVVEPYVAASRIIHEATRTPLMTALS